MKQTLSFNNWGWRRDLSIAQAQLPVGGDVVGCIAHVARQAPPLKLTLLSLGVDTVQLMAIALHNGDTALITEP